MKRRRKNRKKQAQGFVVPMPLVLFLVLGTVTSMAYLWMHGRCEAAGIRIQQLERVQHETRQRRNIEEGKWTQMKTLPRVQDQVARMRLNMTWAPDDRVIQLVRPMPHQVIPIGDLAHMAEGLSH